MLLPASPYQPPALRLRTQFTSAYPILTHPHTHAMVSTPSTLPELLLARAQGASPATVSFLDAAGEVVQKFSYTELYNESLRDAQRLLAAGLRPDKDIVITSFPDHESHIRVFWACCFGRSPFRAKCRVHRVLTPDFLFA